MSRSQKPQKTRQSIVLITQVLLGVALALLLGARPAQTALARLSIAQGAIASGSPIAQSLMPSDLSQQGRELYQSGRFLEASQVWQQAADAYQRSGDSLNQALTLSHLSLAHQQLGQFPQAKQAIDTSLALLKSPESGRDQRRTAVLAQALNAQGNLQLAQGQTEAALATWQEATTLYTQLGDSSGRVGSLINQAQALQTMGFYLQARKLLAEVEQSLQKQEDAQIQSAGLRSLGDSLRSLGDLPGSKRALEQSLAVAQQANLAAEIDSTLLSLGNTVRAGSDATAALRYYQQVAEQAVSPAVRLQARLNQLSLLIETQQWSAAQTLQANLQKALENLPASRTTVYARINFVQSLLRLKQAVANPSLTWQAIAQTAASAVRTAQSLQDVRAEAYALGNLAGVYERTGQWSEAERLTRKALVLAQAVNATDIAYQWQWQLGRVLKAQSRQQGGNLGVYTEAVAAYSEAVKTLKTLRNDLVAFTPDVQFSFRDSVEPVYRQLVGLLLEPIDPQSLQSNLQQAREVIESLQIAQLENFFQEACLNARPTQIDRVDAQAAVVYSIVLEDRLAVILSLPNQPLRYYATRIPQAEIEGRLDRIRRLFRRTAPTGDRLQATQEMYDLLLRPAEADLAASNIETLVFVLDGALQNIPMAALYDGKQYLMEKYRIALAPGLQLLDPQPLTQERLKVLVGGLSEASQGFSALPGVKAEVQNITSNLPSEVLLNQQFTSSTLQSQIEGTPYSVVHLATHGQFSSSAAETFILAWDTPINVKQLDSLLRTREERDRPPIELLVLSACQTATGDRRAALGLAGIAVRSGARSTLATLWPVDDESTALFMVKFYQGLAQQKLTKAEALRRAQIEVQKQPEFSHPYFWAPFVLVGNWL